MTPNGDFASDQAPERLGAEPDDLQRMRAFEAERQTIVGELHDDLLPYLFAAAGSLASLQRQHPELESKLDQPAQWIDQAREITRRIMSGAALPSDFSSGPLVAAKEFLESVVLDSNDAKLSVQWANPDASAEFDWQETQTIAVYRIVCEAVRNVVRHAGATELVVSWQTNANGWTVSIQDNGVGLDWQTVSKSSHGITLMRERAAAAGLRLQIGAGQTEGTEVTVGQVTMASQPE
ncbi:sensor histidine kinase [Rhodopirellula baltica]|uniref:histidine kinase n=1 Tax=Rhodopirellula baltica SWK14 TaxID=993516 RepID=L7C9W6_RHOBT|nr:ATP-binding protein [Rhodopirellula baltica]ELP30610.1 sensor signal transduction histidine kinase [Rhodopirellula baltica SWK14]